MFRYQPLVASLMLALTLSLYCGAPPANADIILDEFTDSAMVTDSLSNTYIETLDVGPLTARREIRIGHFGTDPYGAFDINISELGKLVASIDRIERTGMITPISAVQFNYYFDPTDVTEGGVNDAILLDFVSLAGDIQPSWLRAYARDNTMPTSSYEIRLSPLGPSDERFTVAMPFALFQTRGGGLGVPDATTLQWLAFDFYFLGHSGDLNWEVQLERIRFGSTTAIPEPSSVLMAVLLPVVCRVASTAIAD